MPKRKGPRDGDDDLFGWAKDHPPEPEPEPGDPPPRIPRLRHPKPARLTSPFVNSMTLGDAKLTLGQLLDEGHTCPCCLQFAKVYKRPLNSGMAVSLIRMWRFGEQGWQHIPTSIGAKSREEGKLRYWGLVEEELEKRPDGGRAGWWRVTQAGADFVLNMSTVKKYALIYDGRCLELTGDRISINDALGAKFNYARLMARDA